MCLGIVTLGIGNLKELWKKLDSRKDGFVGFEDFAPDLAAAWDELRVKLRAAGGGSLIKGWLKVAWGSAPGRLA